jgi:hypothetical protein
MTTVATLSNSCRLFVIKDDAEKGPVHASLKTCNEDKDEVSCVAFSDTGGHLVSCTKRGSMTVYKCGDGNKFTELKVERIPTNSSRSAQYKVNLDSILR